MSIAAETQGWKEWSNPGTDPGGELSSTGIASRCPFGLLLKPSSERNSTTSLSSLLHCPKVRKIFLSCNLNLLCCSFNQRCQACGLWSSWRGWEFSSGVSSGGVYPCGYLSQHSGHHSRCCQITQDRALLSSCFGNNAVSNVSVMPLGSLS